MNAKPLFLALAATLALSACQANPQDSVAEEVRRVTSDVAEQIASSGGKVGEDLRRELSSGNLQLGGDHRGQPKAEITPDGELLIDGKALGLDEAGRALARDYREQVIEVAASGAEIGMQAAALASDAVGVSIAAIFEGKGKDLEKAMQARTGDIELAARALCDRLPRLIETQQALVAAVPEFEPYARVHIADGGEHCNFRS